MHNRRVLVAKNVNYAASKGSATQNTALNPADLADGAIGIYGIHTAGSTNLNKLVLITDGGSESAGLVPAASFVGTDIFIAQGNAGRQSTETAKIDVKDGLRSAVAQVYTAPIRGVVNIGYNGTTGSMNFPGTLNRTDDFTVTVINQNYPVAGFRQPNQKVQLTASVLVQGDTTYNTLKNWVAQVNLRTDTILIDKTKIKIRHNGTGAVFTNSATVAGVNGATTLTTSAAHGLTAGDLLSLAGDLYVSQAGTTGSTIVLDRPFQGATATISNANTLDITGAPTAWGLELVDDQDGRNLKYAVSGIAINATITYTTSPIIGSGTYAQVLALEQEALPKKGTEALTDATVPHEAYKAVASSTYDLYTLTVRNLNHNTGQQGSVFLVLNYIYIAFVSGVADTTNLVQSDFEDAMTSLFTTFPAIS